MPTILGLSLPAFTTFHVALSVIGIAAGLVLVRGFLGSHPMNAVTMLFLVTTALTSLTGFLFPFHGVTPGIVIGVLSLILLLAAVVARYAFHVAGAWRWIYVASSITALWFNVFIFVVQSFEKVPFLHALDPTASGLPFKFTQLAMLLIFAWLGVRSVRSYRPADSIIPATA